MRAAVESVVRRKFGPGGPFHPDTPGPFRDTRAVRGAALEHDERFRECVALQAQYIFDTYGKFPGTMPSILVVTYLQAHHLDLSFCKNAANRVVIDIPRGLRALDLRLSWNNRAMLHEEGGRRGW